MWIIITLLILWLAIIIWGFVVNLRDNCYREEAGWKCKGKDCECKKGLKK